MSTGDWRDEEKTKEMSAEGGQVDKVRGWMKGWMNGLGGRLYFLARPRARSVPARMLGRSK